MERRYFRGAAAHSTVCLDKRDPLELWGAFRVGRRPSKNNICAVEWDDCSAVWIGSHNGYRHLPGAPVHERTFVIQRRGIGVFDRIHGRRKHSIESRIHLHPGVEIQPINEKDNLFADTIKHFMNAADCSPSLGLLDISAWRWTMPASGEFSGESGLIIAAWPTGNGIEAVIEEGMYAPAFSRRMVRPVICIAGGIELPLELCWAIVSQ